jgi:vacuolar-type H+-ATPase subunit H
MADTPSPLAVIRDRERAIAQQIRTAQERADARVADARLRSEAMRSQAERDGLRQAQALYEDGLNRARAEANEVLTRGEADAAALREAGRARIQKALEYIIRFVLPHKENESMSQ